MYKRILVPLDGSELAECVLPHVESIAKGCGVVDVVFLRVVEPVFMAETYDEADINPEDVKRMETQVKANAVDYLKQVASRAKYDGTTVETKVVNGRAAESIVDYATKNGVDLIAMATHGRSGPSRWVMGSVADRVVRSGCIAVLMVTPPGCMPKI
ncbi:MAG: universal stress protein [Dehalococcoidales bacterium]|nr:universal stress protein [Dehalococcoidales bacterium]